MKITLTRDIAGHTKGATIERSTKVAQLLIAHGAAVEVEQPKQPSEAASSDATAPKPNRTRRSQRRDQASDSETTKRSDKTAGQGGGAPPRSSSPTAG